jgi:hypothetical protein
VPRGENVHQSIESMNEKAPEEAERGSALHMSSLGRRWREGLDQRGCVPPSNGADHEDLNMVGW